MDIKRLNLQFSIFFLFAVSLQLQCERRVGCAENVYSFDVGIQAVPDLDSVAVGDTVWFSIDDSTSLKDVSSSDVIDYKGADNLTLTVAIAELHGVNDFDTEGNRFFDFVPASAREFIRSDFNSVREYFYVERSGRYQLRLGVIPKKPGVYKLFAGSAANVYRNADKCTKASFAVNFESTNQHLYLNKIIAPDVTLPSGGGIYLFKVY